MKKFLNTRKKVIIASAAAGAIVLGTGGAAYAWFSATGSGNGSATVGRATASWSVTGSNGSTGLYPGETQNVSFTVTNGGAHTLHLDSSLVTATIADDSSAQNGSGNVLQSNGQNSATYTAVTGCDASWFVSAGTGHPITVAPTSSSTADSGGVSVPANGTATVTVPVTMTNADANQDACQGINGPEVTLTFKGSSSTPS